MDWLWSIRPWASLLRDRGSHIALLLRGVLSRWRWSILHNTIPLCRGTRGSSWWLSLLLSLVCQNTVLLSDCHINKLIIRIRPGEVQKLLEFSTQTPTETIPLLGICVSMMSCILTETVEGLGILQHTASPLCESQELIYLPLHKTPQEYDGF